MKEIKKSDPIRNYIDRHPEPAASMMIELDQLISKLIPDAERKLSYGMPAYRSSENLVYFAAFKHHIGFFPTSKPIEHFKEELSDYKTSKGTIQFPFGKKIPAALIRKIVLFRITTVKEKNKSTATIITCKKGHTYTKTSDCRTCPKCEAENKNTNCFVPGLSAPAWRALQAAGIKNKNELKKFGIARLNKLHGVGPQALKLVEEFLKAK
ncbi:MAG: DUF1801 domain-containing protein [Flavobacteriales bacterium]|nr:DUF1801 domain-containing protein [Flavobacteriales bacterium]